MAELADLRRARDVDARSGALDALLGEASEPFVLRGVAADWPLVTAGRRGAAAARAYLAEHAKPVAVPVNYGHAGVGERLFYDPDMGMNFRVEQKALPTILDEMAAHEDGADHDFIYVSSIAMDDAFKDLNSDNRLDLGTRATDARVWIGTRTRIAAHNDVPDNLAVCAVGRRRFTIFPPSAIANLYLGPVEHNPAGRPVSMADLSKPDFERFPELRRAFDEAVVANLEPGDAIHVPSLWYHQVESRNSFNVLVNYWWRRAPRWMGDPELALFHAMMAIRDLDDETRERWKSMFDHYVFGGTGAGDHLPAGKRGILDPLTPETAGRIRTRLLRGLA